MNPRLALLFLLSASTACDSNPNSPADAGTPADAAEVVLDPAPILAELAAAEPGDRVVLPAGTLASNLAVPSGIILEGSPEGGTILTASSGVVLQVTLGAERTELRNLTVRIPVDNMTGIETTGSGGLSITNVSLEASGGQGVTIGNASPLAVSELTCNGLGAAQCIHVSDSSGDLVDVTVVQAGPFGFLVENSVVAITGANVTASDQALMFENTGGTIEQLVVVGTSTDPSLENPLMNLRSPDLFIETASVSGTGFKAIEITGIVNISGLTLDSNFRYGMSAEGNSQLALTSSNLMGEADVMVIGRPTSTVSITDTSITGTGDNSTYGVFVREGALTLRDVELAGFRTVAVLLDHQQDAFSFSSVTVTPESSESYSAIFQDSVGRTVAAPGAAGWDDGISRTEEGLTRDQSLTEPLMLPSGL